LIATAGNFIWGGKAHQSKINLVRMDILARPRKLGGWGLINLKLFGKALLCKSLIRGIFGAGPCILMIQTIYLKGHSLEYWFRRGSIGIKTGSAIWNSYRKILSFFIENLRWRLFSGSSIFIGIDYMINELHLLIPKNLSIYLHSKGYFTWDKLIREWSSSSPVWKDAVELSLSPHFGQLWTAVVQDLMHKGLRCSGNKDTLVWGDSNSRQSIRVKDIYSILIEGSCQDPVYMFPLSMWKVTCPLECILFS